VGAIQVLGEDAGQHLAVLSVADDERVVGRSADPAAHLRPHLDHVALVMTAREHGDRHPLGRSLPRHPGGDLQLVRRDRPHRVVAVAQAPELLEGHQPRLAPEPHEQSLGGVET
jgi:hypothetical protein